MGFHHWTYCSNTYAVIYINNQIPLFLEKKICNNHNNHKGNLPDNNYIMNFNLPDVTFHISYTIYFWQMWMILILIINYSLLKLMFLKIKSNHFQLNLSYLKLRTDWFFFFICDQFSSFVDHCLKKKTLNVALRRRKGREHWRETLFKKYIETIKMLT